MATVRLAETYEEDSLTAVISFVAGLLNEGQAKTALADTPGSRFSDQAAKLVEGGQFEELITLLSSHVDLVLGAPAKDAECCLAVLAHLVKKVSGGEGAEAAAAGEIAAALAAQAGEGAETRLNGMLALYAAAKAPKAKYATLLQVLSYAAASEPLASQLAGAARSRPGEWVRQWALGDAEARTLYLAAAQLLRAVGDRSGYLRLATDALALVPASDAAALAAAKGPALQAVKDWVAAPDNFTCDFTGLPAVAALEKDAAAAPFLKLLQVMLSGDMAGFKAAATAEVLSGVPVAQEVALDKMRYMALLGVAYKAAGGAVALSEVQTALGVAESEVQPWVIRAIGKRLVEGKIDQVAGTLTATRCHRRAFGAHEWGSLAAQLAALSDSLAGVSDRVAAAVAAHVPSAAPGAGGGAAAGAPAAPAAVRA